LEGSADLGAVQLDSENPVLSIEAVVTVVGVASGPDLSVSVVLDATNAAEESGEIQLWLLDEPWSEGEVTFDHGDLLETHIIEAAVGADPADASTTLFSYNIPLDPSEELPLHLVLQLEGGAEVSGTAVLEVEIRTYDEPEEDAAVYVEVL
jgi:hypothetical protein